jgi:hypothetical protein
VCTRIELRCKLTLTQLLLCIQSHCKSVLPIKQGDAPNSVVTKRWVTGGSIVLALLAIIPLCFSYYYESNEAAAAAVTAEHAAAVLLSHHKVWYTEAWEQLYENMLPLMSQLSLQVRAWSHYMVTLKRSLHHTKLPLRSLLLL